MILHYSVGNEEINGVVERLKNLSLAYSIEISDAPIRPFIKEGNREYHSIDKIHEYLDQLADEREQWYYCDC